MTEEKIIDRIRKMLALANDLAATEAERDTALQMAYKLLAKHNLSMTDIGEKQTDEPRIDSDSKCWSFPWARQVANNIARLFFCSHYYQRNINGTQCTHHFVGKESNAMTAMVMSDYIINSILKEGRKLYKQNTTPECRSFCTGASYALRNRINKLIRDQEAEIQATTGRDLVLASLYKLEADANEAFIANSVGKLKTTPARHSEVDYNAYNSGHEFGKKINLSLQVDTPKNGHKLIGNMK